MTPCTIEALFARHIAEIPCRPAILAPGRRPLSYAALGEQLDSMQARLAGWGLGREDRVASLLPYGPEAATALLTITSRATYAPLNLALRAEELENLLVDLAPAALLVEQGSVPDARNVARNLGIPVLDACWAPGDPAGVFRIELNGDHPRRRSVPDAPGPEHIAVILSTSGTSGRPKLVPLTQQCFFQTAKALVESLALTPEDRCLSFSPMFHVIGSNGGLLGPIAGGGSVVCAPEFHALEFFRWLDDFRPTFFSAVPAVHQAILERCGQHAEILARQRIRFMRTGGAPMSPHVVAAIEAAFRAPLLQVYGMTEAPPIANECVPPHPRKPGSVGILRCLKVAAMDLDGNLLPEGSTGEIVVSGPAVTPGYLNNPAANAESFVDGWFRTGDMGHVDADGFLFVTGRRSEFINRGGENISPVEIDDALLSHPAVAEAVTFAVPDVRLGQEIAAAVVARSPVTLAELQRHVGRLLADHKVPRRIVLVTEVPKGPTGKVSRDRMAEALGLDRLAAAAPAEFVAPRNEIEQRLCSIWAELLGVARIGIHDNFFEAGGDSLLAAHCLARVAESYSFQHLPLTVLLQAPTVGQLAELLAAPEQLSASQRVLPIQPRGDRVPLFVVGPGLEFARLAQHLGPEYPMFGLKLRPDGAARSSIQELAADALEALRQFRPHGPYALTGWCLSGVVALEMAHQLDEMGQQVDLLVMVDSRIIPTERRVGVDRLVIPLVHHLQNFSFHMHRAWRLGNRELARYLWARVQAVALRARRVARRATETPTQDYEELTLDALFRYRWPRYSGEVVHLWAAERPDGLFRDLEFYWGGTARRQTVLEVPGDHVSIFLEPNVTAMAAHYRALLDRLDARQPAA